MKASELRVGNMVNLGVVYEIGVVYKIDEYKFYVYDKDGKKFGSSWAKIEPIPLTEEWLLRFGFEKDNSSYSWSKIIEDEQKQFIIEIDSFPNEKDCFWFMSKHFNQLKYVHQIQNLYFTLAGKELTIK